MIRLASNEGAIGALWMHLPDLDASLPPWTFAFLPIVEPQSPCLDIPRPKIWSSWAISPQNAGGKIVGLNGVRTHCCGDPYEFRWGFLDWYVRITYRAR